MQVLLVDATSAMPRETNHYPAVIVTLRWPEESDRRDHLAAAGIPRLLLVSPGAAPPPVWAVEEDWLWTDAPVGDRAHREATLRRRLDLIAGPAPPLTSSIALDEDGLVRRHGRWVALTELEVRLVRPLLAANGRSVSRADLLQAGWIGERRHDRAVDGAIRRMRSKLRPVGVQIHGITGVGYLLEVVAAPAP
ncbi:MAG TPA: winged helix-turn-helix domain-containing protein [Acidimicrobiales bacterium]